jgi:predicted permease
MLTDLLHRLRAIFRRNTVEREVDDELRFHVDRQVEEHTRAGLGHVEALRRVRLEFGGLDQVKEEYRDSLGVRLLSDLRGDVLLAARMLRRRPGFAASAILTLALGVGGTAAVYGVAASVLFEPLPYAHEGEVGVFWKKTDWAEWEFLHIRGRVPGFREVALYRQRDVLLRDGDAPPRLVPGVASSAELFDVLGAHPLVGRGFRSGDDVPGAEPVALLSFGLWQELGGDPSVVGKRLMFDGTPRTVIGVMPRGFWFPDPSVRVWTSVPLRPEAVSWNSTLVGRVGPGHDVRAMSGPVGQLVTMLDERFDYPEQWDKTRDARITPIRDDLTGAMRPALLATLGAMALILLMACANTGALMLGHANARSVEMAVRSALGAGRRRLIQSLVIEVLLIASVAGVLGAGIAWVAFDLMTDALPLGAWGESAAPDWRVFASAMVLAVAAGVLVALVPGTSVYRSDLRGVLNSARTGGIEGRGGRLESALVIAEVALAVMIAIGAALLARSVAHLYDIDPGVRTDRVAVVDVVFGGEMNRSRREQVITELITALRLLPGVESVGAVQTLPLEGGGYRLPMRIVERPDLRAGTEYRVVTPGYLESIGIAIQRGRTITDADRATTERVVVINEALAQTFFGGVDPIGKMLRGDVDEASRVVGVVGNAIETDLTEAVPPVRYVALAQMEWIDDAPSLVLRAAPGVDETSLLEPARQTIARVAPSVAVQRTTTMRRVLDTAIGPARQVVSLLAMLTALALTLGAVGIYGVIAHFAARHRRDWAIRVALGLSSSRVIGHVLGRGASLVAAGIGAGAIGAAALTKWLSSFLYGVSALDPAAFLAAGAALLAVGLLAALFPAWRAGTADPLIALREQ